LFDANRSGVPVLAVAADIPAAARERPGMLAGGLAP
jgi:hypothetical protein